MKIHLQKIKVDLCLMLLLALMVGGLLASAAHFDFINFDDNIYVTQNPPVSSGMSFENLQWAFSTHRGGHWHPLTWLSHQFDCHVFGLNPGAMHAINILFHILNVSLFFLLLNRLVGNALLAFFCALFFALHPLRLESVIWISERKDVLSLFWGLLTFHVYLSYQKRNSLGLYLLLLLCWLLSLLAKPTLVVLPFLLLLLDCLPGRRSVVELKRKVWLEKLPLFFLCLLLSGLVYFTQKKSGTMNSFAELSFLNRAGTAMVHFWLYAIKSVWPMHLSVFYPRVNYSLGLQCVASFSFLLLVFFLMRRRQAQPLLFFAWLWFFISLLPILGFVQIGGQGIANRWTYLPHLGLLIALAFFLNPFTRSSAFKVYLPFASIILLFAGKTYLDLPQWKNSEALFSQALASNPGNFLAHNNLAIALEKRGDLKAAKQHYEVALRLHPTYSEALDNLGRLLAQQGDYRAALLLFEKSLAGNPQNIEARYNLALAHYHLGEKQQALIQWLETIGQDPFYTPALASLNFMARREWEMPCQLKGENNLALRAVLDKLNGKLRDERLRAALKHWQECLP